MSMLEIKDLNVFYGEFQALNGIELEVQKSRIVSLMGANSAGKSTLLKIISRITYPTAGTIKIKGKISSLLEVGTGFHRELSGRENIYLNGAILGMNKATTTKRLDEIIDFAGIEKFVDTPVKRYSSGMYVRLAFSVAAHLDSDILILDEATSAVDSATEASIQEAMDRLVKGRTTIAIAHRLSTLRNADKLIVVQDGLIAEAGSHQELLDANGIYADLCNKQAAFAQQIVGGSQALFEG